MKYANFKRMTAMVMAAAMMCSPVAAMAAGGTTETDATDMDKANGTSITGTAKVKYTSTDVFRVKLPTVSNLDFVLDPQGLLTVADADNFTAGPGGLYFKDSDADPDEDEPSHSNKSDDIIFYNKSSFDVDVAVSAELKLPEGIDAADKNTKLDKVTTPTVKLTLNEVTKDEKIYLKDGENYYDELTAERVPEVREEDSDNDIDAIENGYEFVAKAGKTGTDAEVVYQLTEDFKDEYVEDEGKLIFNLEGECDTSADWSGVSTETASVKLTWKIQKHQEAPEKTTASEKSVAIEGGTVQVDFPTGETLSGIQYYDTAEKDYKALDTKYYTSATTVNGVKVVFSDLSELKISKIKFVATTKADENSIEIDVTTAPAAPTVPTASKTEISNKGDSVDITYPEGTKITAVQRAKSDGVTYTTLSTSYYTLSDIENGQTITFEDFSTYTSKTIKITFSEGDPIILNVK